MRLFSVFDDSSGFKPSDFGYLDLDAAFREHQRKRLAPRAKRSVALNPAVMDSFVASWALEYGIRFPYGGWLEDRSSLWQGSYMKEFGSFIHVGLDITAPKLTPILAPFDATVVLTETDDEMHGWGGNISLRLADDPAHVMIIAHLCDIQVAPKQAIKKGQVIGFVAGSNKNVGWWPHVHFQIVTWAAYERHMREGFANLDGYVSRRKLKTALREFRDPLPFLIAA